VSEPEPTEGPPAPDDAGAGAMFPLPAKVRGHLVELAATVLGELEENLTPPALARVRRFAPARRARAGAAPLVLGLERDAGFRARVAAAWRARNPDVAAALDAGTDPGPADPGAVVVGLYLLRPPGWSAAAARVAQAVARAEDERVRQEERGVSAARLRGLERELELLRADLAAARADAAAAQDELVAARRETRRLRADADRARAAARAAALDGEALRASADEAVLQAEQELSRERDRSTSAEERADQAMRAGREGRSLADARVRLLLDTVVEAAAGLRRELALPPVDVRPADLVAGAAEPGAPARGDGAGRGQPADDPAVLAQLLAMPQAHLVVDGYNVTKTGFPALPLVDQRRRLVDALVPLAARTGAEVTCVFDGAEVDGRSAQRVRGVRVLFSDPGTTADELIRRLVRAEPPGRPIVVVSSDNEVARGVRASGARALPAGALLRLLGRG
jgi:predicted RNA-binding protein with PIN domain